MDESILDGECLAQCKIVFKQRWDAVILKYTKLACSEESDVVDLETFSIEEDYGSLRKVTKPMTFGKAFSFKGSGLAKIAEGDAALLSQELVEGPPDITPADETKWQRGQLYQAHIKARDAIVDILAMDMDVSTKAASRPLQKRTRYGSGSEGDVEFSSIDSGMELDMEISCANNLSSQASLCVQPVNTCITSSSETMQKSGLSSLGLAKKTVEYETKPSESEICKRSQSDLDADYKNKGRYQTRSSASPLVALPVEANRVLRVCIKKLMLDDSLNHNPQFTSISNPFSKESKHVEAKGNVPALDIKCKIAKEKSFVFNQSATEKLISVSENVHIGNVETSLPHVGKSKDSCDLLVNSSKDSQQLSLNNELPISVPSYDSLSCCNESDRNLNTGRSAHSNAKFYMSLDKGAKNLRGYAEESVNEPAKSLNCSSDFRTDSVSETGAQCNVTFCVDTSGGKSDPESRTPSTESVKLLSCTSDSEDDLITNTQSHSSDSKDECLSDTRTLCNVAFCVDTEECEKKFKSVSDIEASPSSSPIIESVKLLSCTSDSEDNCICNINTLSYISDSKDDCTSDTITPCTAIACGTTSKRRKGSANDTKTSAVSVSQSEHLGFPHLLGNSIKCGADQSTPSLSKTFVINPAKVLCTYQNDGSESAIQECSKVPDTDTDENLCSYSQRNEFFDNFIKMSNLESPYMEGSKSSKNSSHGKCENLVNSSGVVGGFQKCDISFENVAQEELGMLNKVVSNKSYGSQDTTLHIDEKIVQLEPSKDLLDFQPHRPLKPDKSGIHEMLLRLSPFFALSFLPSTSQLEANYAFNFISAGIENLEKLSLSDEAKSAKSDVLQKCYIILRDIKNSLKNNEQFESANRIVKSEIKVDPDENYDNVHNWNYIKNELDGKTDKPKTVDHCDKSLKYIKSEIEVSAKTSIFGKITPLDETANPDKPKLKSFTMQDNYRVTRSQSKNTKQDTESLRNNEREGSLTKSGKHGFLKKEKENNEKLGNSTELKQDAKNRYFLRQLTSRKTINYSSVVTKKPSCLPLKGPSESHYNLRHSRVQQQASKSLNDLNYSLFPSKQVQTTTVSNNNNPTSVPRQCHFVGAWSNESAETHPRVSKNQKHLFSSRNMASYKTKGETVLQINNDTNTWVDKSAYHYSKSSDNKINERSNTKKQTKAKKNSVGKNRYPDVCIAEDTDIFSEDTDIRINSPPGLSLSHVHMPAIIFKGNPRNAHLTNVKVEPDLLETLQTSDVSSDVFKAEKNYKINCISLEERVDCWSKQHSRNTRKRKNTKDTNRNMQRSKRFKCSTPRARKFHETLGISISSIGSDGDAD